MYNVYYYLKVLDADNLHLNYKMLSCHPFTDCHSMLNFDEATGKITLKKSGQNGFDHKFFLTVQVRLLIIKL